MHRQSDLTIEQILMDCEGMSDAKTDRPQVVPCEYGGKWLAWTPNGLNILGAGNTPEEARKAADAKGPQPALDWKPGMNVAYQWMPPADERFIGTSLL
jgi:hypothetical protein